MGKGRGTKIQKKLFLLYQVKLLIEINYLNERV